MDAVGITGSRRTRRVRREIMQRNNSCNNRRKRGGDLGIAQVDEMVLPIHAQGVDGRVERLAHVAGIPGKTDQHPAWRDAFDSKAV